MPRRSRQPEPMRSATLVMTVRAVAALMVLNQLLAFSAWWPTPGVVPDRRIAPEFVGLWLVLLALVAWRGALAPRVATVLTAAYLLLVAGRYLDVTVPSMFGRGINLFWDIPQIPRPLWVWAQSAPVWLVAAAIGGAVALVALLWVVTRASIVIVARDVIPHARRSRIALVVTALCAAVVAANYAGVRATWPYVSKPVMPTYWRQAKILAAAFSTRAQAVVLPPSTTLDAAMANPNALAALAGRDVFVIMLESYGAVVHDDPRARAPMQQARARFAADIAAGGRKVVSAFVRSPTFAGASDLAHLSLLSGIDLSDPMRHDVLLTSQRPTLLTLFRAHGYRTFGVYPALSWEWPERHFYGFDVFVDGPALDYRGPKLGYWHVPDAVTLEKVETLHPRHAAAPPHFVFFPTITTHLPFSPVPPLQDDVERLLSAQPFDDAATRRALAKAPNWLDMFPDYLEMMSYQHAWLGGHLRRREPREAVYLLVGDHQPAANITGEGASWDVPVHVVSRDAALLARFEAHGFAPGLEPPRRSLGGMHELTGMLMEAFSAATPTPAAVASNRSDESGAGERSRRGTPPRHGTPLAGKVTP
jgi:hypothetical protein